MITKEEILKDCIIEGNIVKLPNIKLDRKIYLEVAKSLELIGGSWKGGKVSGFIFKEDPTELLNDISNGEKRNLKKEFQFFATPNSLADWLIELADVNETHSILEPSAGQGAIINAIHRVVDVPIDCYELMPVNQIFLKKIKNVNFLNDDFLNNDKTILYDRIIANPPFSKNQDILHVKEMYNKLKAGGRLVSITSKHWELSSNKKESEFRDWLDSVGAEIYDIDKGSFKESGTLVGGFILVINKR